MHPNDTILNDYVDGALGAGERAGVDAHLTGCAACRQTVEDLREIARAGRALDPREPPVRAWSRLERAIRLEREHAEDARGGQPGGSRAGNTASGSRATWLVGLAAA